jgi:hypothetical protein
MATETPERSFGKLTRELASGTLSRSRALRLMGAALVGGALGSLGMREAAADQCKRNGKVCMKDNQCCSGNCEGGTCAPCPADRIVLSNGSCAKRCDADNVCAACDPVQWIAYHAEIVKGICADFSVFSGNSCLSDADCPRGEFCAGSFAVPGVCVGTC